MLVRVVFFSGLIHWCLGDGMSSIYYCSDMNPQPHVDIEQLTGMWYGIEIIYHNSEAKHEVVYEDGCPVFYLSIDTSNMTNYTDHREHNYNINYGYGYGRRSDGNLYDNSQNQDQYTTQTNLYGYQYQSREDYYKSRYGGGPTNPNQRREMEEKRLRLLWHERGDQTEYNIKYNITKAGFWMSSGPQNGYALEERFNHFAGTIQVLKAVGNHLVLIFCYQLPKQELFTVLMSRVQYLSQHEIHGVHNLLTRRGLSTNSVKKVCNGGSTKTVSLVVALFCISVLSLFLK